MDILGISYWLSPSECWEIHEESGDLPEGFMSPQRGTLAGFLEDGSMFSQMTFILEHLHVLPEAEGSQEA